MSAKKSKLKSSWLYCENLRGYTLQGYREAADASSDESNDFTHFASPFISKEGITLLAAQVKTSFKEKVNEAANVRNSIVEIHPDTMQLCGMRLGGPVVLTAMSSDANQPLSKAAFQIWPSVLLLLGKVSLPEDYIEKLHVRDGDFFSVCKAEACCISAQTATVRVDRSDTIGVKILNTVHFKKYLHQILDKKYFIKGQLMAIEYFGKIIHLEIISAVGVKSQSSRHAVTTSVKSNSSLDETFANISLHSSGEEKSVLNDTEECGDFSIDEIKHKLSDETPVFQFMRGTKLCIVDCGEAQSMLHEKEAASYFGDTKYEDIGGLKMQITNLKNLVELPLQKSGLFKVSGLDPPTGVLLHGAPGTGKSMLVKACANESSANVFLLEGAKIMSRYFGDSEQRLHDLFQEAQEVAPSIIVVEEIDAICTQRESSRTDVEKRLVSSFVTLLDGITSANKLSSSYVIVLATTNRIDALDPSLRRAGRFDSEIELPVPSPDERIEIFSKLLSGMSHTLTTCDIEAIAERAHGYVGADIAAVCRETGLRALQQTLAKSSKGDQGTFSLTCEDFEYGLKLVPPSAMRELLIQVPKVLWSDIGGNIDVKKKLKQAVEWPLKNPDAFKRLGIEPPRGVLLYGPPGCSKTLTAKALATESGLNFISVKGPELFSKYVGDSEREVRRIFSKARSVAPSIIFFDELDALAIERGRKHSGGNVGDRVLAAMLTEMDGVEQRRDVIVIAATNRPDMIDKALLRPGRIDRIVHVSLPDPETRRDIFQIQFRRMPVATNVDMEDLVRKTEMYSGAEICAVCREAALMALDSDMDATEISPEDFERAIAAIPPQTTKEVARMHTEYSKTLQAHMKS